jgi:uncharacterized protein YraI
MTSSLKLVGAAGALLLASGITASAVPAVVTTDLNVRGGESTRYSVIGVMPEGTVVDVTGCGDGWCYVRDYDGYASAQYLDYGRATYRTDRYAYAPARVHEPSFGLYFGSPSYHPWGPFGWW